MRQVPFTDLVLFMCPLRSYRETRTPVGDNVKSTEANVLTHLFLADCDGSEETWLPGIVDLFLVIWSGVRGHRVPPAPPTLGHRRSGHWIVWNCICPTRPTTSSARIPVCTTIEAAAVVGASLVLAVTGIGSGTPNKRAGISGSGSLTFERGKF